MVKLADTLQAMADFPVAMASGINIVKEDDTEKDLQQMYEDGELGGESMPMPLSANMLLVSENDETSGDLIWSQIDKSEVGSVPLICTEQEWEELDPKPVEGTEVIITDDEIDGDSLPFKFGIDENGNYGYYKVGADTVTPFNNLKILNYVARPRGADGTHNDTFEVEKDGRYVVIGNANADGRTNSTLTISVDGKTPLETKREANQIVYVDNVARTNNVHQCSIYDLQKGDIIKCSTYVYGYGAVSFVVIGIE